MTDLDLSLMQGAEVRELRAEVERLTRERDAERYFTLRRVRAIEELRADLAAARERIQSLEMTAAPEAFGDLAADNALLRARITALTDALRILVVEDRNEYSGVRLLRRGRDLTILEYLNQDEAAKVRAAAALLREGESKT